MLEIFEKGETLWDRTWGDMPSSQRDVFARRCYYEAFSAPDELAIPECAVLRDHRGIIMHPYFRCPLTRYEWLDAPPDRFDLISAYGYSGIYGNVECPDLVDDYLQMFNEYCNSTGIVAEVVRLNPLMDVPPSLRKTHRLLRANSQVVVDCQRSDEDIFGSYLHNNRKNVKKALRSGVSIIRESVDGRRFGDFRKIYEDTMQRRCAREGFLFPEVFYQKLHEGLSEKIQVFYSVLEGISISAELVLCSDSSVYSFLGGTLKEYYDIRPNNLLKHEIIKWARDNGYGFFLLGGGPEGNDGIYEYKRSFAPQGVIDYHLASRVYDHELYQALIEKCMLHAPQSGEQAAAYTLRWRYAEENLY